MKDGTSSILTASKYEQRARRTAEGLIAMQATDWRFGWQFLAACRGEDTSLFFAPSHFEKREEKNAREAKAKAICAVCPVRVDCREYSLRIREPHGVWGGLNEFERRAVLRARSQERAAG